MRLLAAAILAAASACACAQSAPLRIVDTWPLTARELPYAGAAPATHRLQLELFMFDDTPWRREVILQAVRNIAPILAQCGVWLERAELKRLGGGDSRLRDLATPVSRQLVRRMQPAKPAVFFVRDTRHEPAFDAEALGRGNTATRPELAGTVWVTAPVRDLPVALAHELAHVLMDSGEHSPEPGNLMREATVPDATRLAPEQCQRIVTNGTENGWLQRVRARE
ncbi:MAG TPA: hypothetical protein VJM14_10980 [Burkholderiales bacterium]|nr:hypothetical protein [Burkholderiales bacterium]